MQYHRISSIVGQQTSGGQSKLFCSRRRSAHLAGVILYGLSC